MRTRRRPPALTPGLPARLVDIALPTLPYSLPSSNSYSPGACECEGDGIEGKNALVGDDTSDGAAEAAEYADNDDNDGCDEGGNEKSSGWRPAAPNDDA